MTQQIVAALIIHSDRILLGHRSPTRAFYPDVWDVFGGHMEPDETQAQTLVRELEEELGITAMQWRYLETLPLPDRMPNLPPLPLHLYRVSRWAGWPQNMQAHEHTRIEWFTMPQAVQLKLAHPAFPELFTKYFTDH